MAKLVTEIVYGFDKQEAMSNVQLEIKHNATTKWRNEGMPTFGSPKFLEFCEAFVENKKITKGGGAFIVKDAAQKDTRLRPYKVFSYKKEGKTKWETVYNICEFNPLTKEVGATVNNEATTKSEAETIAKNLTSQNKKSYVCRKTKEVVEDENSKNGEILFDCIYTPSISANPGEFYVFGIKNE